MNVIKPRVARNELPWVAVTSDHPERVESIVIAIAAD
jgi:hypothetical protein